MSLLPKMAPKITNLYVICGLSTLGGLLQGFGVSSLSAILATWQVRCPLLFLHCVHQQN